MEAVWSVGKVLARISKGDGFQPPFCLGVLQLWPIVVRQRLGAARGALAGCRSWAVTERQQAAWGCPHCWGPGSSHPSVWYDLIPHRIRSRLSETDLERKVPLRTPFLAWGLKDWAQGTHVPPCEPDTMSLSQIRVVSLWGLPAFAEGPSEGLSPPFSDLEISTPSLSRSVGGEQRHSETRVGVNVRDPKMKVAFRTELGGRLCQLSTALGRLFKVLLTCAFRHLFQRCMTENAFHSKASGK